MSTRIQTVMFYINQIYEGGAERVIVYLANQFADEGFQSILVTSFQHKNEYKVSKKVVRISLEEGELTQSFIRRNYNRTRKLRRICMKHKPQVLISFMSEPNMRAMVATAGLNIKNIISVRGDPNREYCGKIRRFWGKHIFPFADGCVFQTEEARRWFPQKLQKKSKIIINPVGSEFYGIERKTISHKIITCGRLKPIKNHKMLIDAFAKLAGHFQDATLEIYGDGPMRGALNRQINELGLKNKVFIRGQTQNVGRVLSEADLFVLSSDAEGMPNSLLEALAVGVPCIATDCPCGGPRRLITSGIDGILIPVGDVEALERNMERLFIDSDFAKKIGREARVRAQAYTTKRIFKEWKDYIEEVVCR